MKRSRSVLGRWSRRFFVRHGLALVPLVVALVFGVLLLPRSIPPESVPLPVANTERVAEEARVDHMRAERAQRDPLPANVRALGTALRAFHTLEAQGATAEELSAARGDALALLPAALGDGTEALLALRAVQLEGFVDEIRRFERTGEETPELRALAGGFIARMRREAWCVAPKDRPPSPTACSLLPEEQVLRVMFKQMWNKALGMDDTPGFAPSLDELRLLYAFYLRHPRVPDRWRGALDLARQGADDPAVRAKVTETERLAREAWRLERIRQLAAVDPEYPAAFARGVVEYRRGQYRASAGAFEAWLDEHPDGPFALRARYHLRAALEADRQEAP